MSLAWITGLGLLGFSLLQLLLVCSAAVDIIRIMIYDTTNSRQQTLFSRARSPLASLPGPWYSKWTGAVLHFHFIRGQRPPYVQRLHEKYGRIVRISPNQVDFSSVTAAKRIHSYTRPLRKGHMYHDLAGGGKFVNIFSTQDFEYHQRHRRLLSAPLSESGLKGVEHVVEERAKLAVQRIGEEMKSEGRADVMKWWLFFSADVIGELSFGNSFRMLERGSVGHPSSHCRPCERCA